MKDQQLSHNDRRDNIVKEMALHRIPIKKLSKRALKGVIDEFISRDGTDYGEIEVSPATMFETVKSKLENGSAILIFDDDTETTNILLANDPILKKLATVTPSWEHES